MKRRCIILLILVVANLSIFAQIPKKWKDISPTDFSYTTNGDTSVHAVILQEQGKYYFDVWREELKMFIQVTRRILILDDNGVGYSHLEMPYISYSNYEEFINFNAIVYNLENGKVKKTKLKSKDEIDIDKKNGYSVKVVDLQNVKVGSIIEYKYTFTTLGIIEPPQWNFQHEIPCLYSSVDVVLPDFINYRMITVGGSSLMQQIKEQANMVLDYMLHYVDPIPSGSNYDNQSFNAPVNFSFLAINYKFILNNIPAYKSRDYTDCDCNYKRALKLELYRIDQKNGLTSDINIFAWNILTQRLYQSVQDRYELHSQLLTSVSDNPSGYIVYQASSWDYFEKKMKKNKNFGLALMKYWQFYNELQLANSKADSTDLSKLISIYNYVRDSYSWNGNYDIFISADLEQITKQKNGNSADINFMLIYLLKKMGLDAFPILIKTVDKGLVEPGWATSFQFNHVLAGVKIGNKTYQLDAINKDIPWYLLDVNDLNNVGLKSLTVDTGFIKISPNKKSFSSNNLTITFNDNKADFLLKITDLGYSAQDKRKKINIWINNFKAKNTNISNVDYSRNNIDDDNLPLETIISFADDNYLNSNKIYPFDFFDIEYNFNNPDRNIPVYFGYKFSKVYQINITIPNNKKVKTLPVIFSKSINGASISSKIITDTSTVTIFLTININKSLFLTDEYSDLRNMFLELDNFINSPIIFE